jgi:hypothetical protein
MSTPRDPYGRPAEEAELSARLRRALTAEADGVTPAGDGLGRIRARIEERRGRQWWRSPVPVLAAAVVAGLLVGGIGLGLSGDGDDDPVVATTPSPDRGTQEAPTPSDSASPTGSAEPSATGSPDPSGSGSPEPGTPSVIEVPVYYLYDDGRGPRLYREFHQVERLGQGRIATAVTEMFGDRAVDPDYSSAWPAATQVLGVRLDGSIATVDLSRAALDASVGSQAAEVSLQQLVYTVTAAQPQVSRVRVLVEGARVDQLWGHVAVGDRAFPRASALDVQGLVWILTPRQGRAYGSPVQVTVYGTAFEGNVTLKAFRDGTEVASTFVTTAMGDFVEASTDLSLEPGTYVLRAYDENAETGELVERDSKEFAVR